MPRLVDGAGAGHVEPDLDDLVIRAEDIRADGVHPGMRGELDKSPDALGMDLDIVALGTAPDRAAGA